MPSFLVLQQVPSFANYIARYEFRFQNLVWAWLAWLACHSFLFSSPIQLHIAPLMLLVLLTWMSSTYTTGVAGPQAFAGVEPLLKQLEEREWTWLGLQH